MTAKRRPLRRHIACLLLLLAAAGAGCKKEEPPQQPQAQPQNPAPAAQPAAPVQAQLSSAARPGGAFDFSKRTDPFKSQAPAPVPVPGAAGQQGAPAAVPAGDLLPIQSYEVTRFKVAGIIAGLRENRALVIDPSGKGYVVQVGMQIGNANGRVSKITASTVEVVERYKDSGGRTRSRIIVLTLAKKR